MTGLFCIQEPGTVPGASSRRTPLSVGRCRVRRRTLARAQCLGAERLDAQSGRPDL